MKKCRTNSFDDSATHKHIRSSNEASAEQLQLFRAILACIIQFTDLLPDILYCHTCDDIVIRWQGEIPDEYTTFEIEEALKRFGTPVPHHERLCKYVSFLIVR